MRASDLEINELFKRYIPKPVMVIVNVSPDVVGIPTDAYFAVEEIKDVSSPMLNCFTNISTLFAGRHGDSKDILTCSVSYRSGGSGGNWCRAFTTRYQGFYHHYSCHSCQRTAGVIARPSVKTQRCARISCGRCPREISSQSPDSLSPTRRIQSSPRPRRSNNNTKLRIQHERSAFGRLFEQFDSGRHCSPCFD